jgi:prepilin peptidase CpaA
MRTTRNEDNQLTSLPTMTPSGMLLLLLPFLAVAVATDLHSRKIPNVLVGFMLASGLLLHVLLFGAAGLAASAAGVVIGFLILIPLYALGGMGAGDVKLLAAAGSFLGPWGALLAGIFTLLAGGALGLGALMWQRIVIPMVAVYEFLPRILGRIGTDRKIPYSLAIAAGTITSVLYAASSVGAAPGTSHVATIAGVATW